MQWNIALITATAWGDLAGWAAAVVGLFGLIFTGIQLLNLKRQERDRLVAEIEGVAVSWDISYPRKPDESGMGKWSLVFTAYNPGKLPIADITVRINLSDEVQRIRKDERLELTRAVVLSAPVIAAGEKYTWRRNFGRKFPTDDSARKAIRQWLESITASIDFQDVKGQQHRNDWPRGTTSLESLQEDD
jgi:hypothetical protein